MIERPVRGLVVDEPGPFQRTEGGTESRRTDVREGPVEIPVTHRSELPEEREDAQAPFGSRHVDHSCWRTGAYELHGPRWFTTGVRSGPLLDRPGRTLRYDV